MKGRRFTLLDIATIVLTAVILAIAAWVATRGPAGPIPMQFDLQGQPSRWGDRTELAWVLGLMAAVAGLGGGAMGWFARKADDPARRRGLVFGQIVTLLAAGGVTAMMVTTLLGDSFGLVTSGPGGMMAGTGLLFLVIGAFLGRVAPNPLVGVRTPWNYKSRLAWDRSNRLAGRQFFWLGLAALVASPFAPQPLGMMATVSTILVAAVWSIFESWRVWRSDPDRQPF